MTLTFAQSLENDVDTTAHLAAETKIDVQDE